MRRHFREALIVPARRAIFALLVLCVACTSAPGATLHGATPRPLPTSALHGYPSTFVGVWQPEPGDVPRLVKQAIELFSTADGAPIRELASMPRNSGDLGLDLAYPSRGPTGDVWFVLTTDTCLSALYRIDSNTGRLSLALKR